MKNTNQQFMGKNTNGTYVKRCSFLLVDKMKLKSEFFFSLLRLVKRKKSENISYFEDVGKQKCFMDT